MNWSIESLWLKSKLFAERAHRAQHVSGEFPLFCILSLEMLARAALARIHPALLADPKNDDGASILYVFGYSKGLPKSVEMKTVISRLKVIIPEFSDDYARKVSDLVRLRNEELHTGSATLNSLKDSDWLPNYYEVSDCLCRSIGKTLDDLLGTQHSIVAQVMISELQKELLAVVGKRIASHRDQFLARPPNEQAGLREKVSVLTILDQLRAKADGNYVALDTCPACDARSRLAGKSVDEGQPVLIAGRLLSKRTVLAQQMWCRACGLDLHSSSELRIAKVELRFFQEFAVNTIESVDSEEDEEPYMNM